MSQELNPEEKARQTIDERLEKQGWNEIEETVGTGYIEEYPTDSGPVDYALVLNGEIIGLVEAKEEGKDAYAALTQAERYSKDIDTHYDFGSEGKYHIPFVFATNGEDLHFRDLREHSPAERELREFLRPEALEELMEKNYEKAFDWLSKNPVEETHGFLWPNQKGAIAGDQEHKGIEKAFAEGKRKALVQMATGTGKTWMAAAEIYRMLKSDLVDRVLFLVDRSNLGRQARREFENFDIGRGRKLGEEYSVARVENGNYPETGDIVVSTLQGMYSLLENHDEVDIPQHAFDLVVTDEVHRSIYGEWKVVLSHFDSYEIGLTATPAQHTLAYFENGGEWVYKYGYWQAVDDGKVVPYETYRIETGITMEGLEYDGEDYNPSQLERDITVPHRNKLIAEKVREETEDGEKTLVFAINDKHAIELEKKFRQVYSDKSNDYVKKITYTTDNADDWLKKFKNVHMEPTIAVTVEMVSTGTDVKPLENIVFARPVKSPILYNQMVGRGTRNCDDIDKKKFTLFDCVGVVDYFHDQQHPPFDQYRDIDRDQETDSSEGDGGDDGGTEGVKVAEDVRDEITESGYVFQTEEGEEMRPDDYITAFENYITNNEDQVEAIRILKNRPSELKREHLEELNEKLKEQSEHFTEERLQKAYSEEMVDLLGFVKHAIGEDEFPTTDERVEKAFDVWKKENEFSEEEQKWLNMMRQHFKSEKTIQKDDFEKLPFLRAGGWESAAEAFGGEDNLKETLEELNEQVILA